MLLIQNGLLYTMEDERPLRRRSAGDRQPRALYSHRRAGRLAERRMNKEQPHPGGCGCQFTGYHARVLRNINLRATWMPIL